MNASPARFTPRSSAAILSLALSSLVWTLLAADAPVLQHRSNTDEIARLFAAQLTHADALPQTEHEYVEVMDGCGPYYGGECIHTYARPEEGARVVTRLRKGVVLKVEPVVSGLRTWYKVVFDEPVRYPERLVREQYISIDDVRHFYGDGVEELERVQASTTKHILVDRSDQMLYAYDGEELFMQVRISTGIQLTPTPRGTFTVYRKTPTRYMQGPLPGISTKYYDLPGVPWNLYFTNEGGVIHGAYWHDKLGRPWSNGCVNLPLAEARELYEWADIGTKVFVRD